MKQQFNLEEYSKLKHRVEALQSRVNLDVGPEQETAKRLLVKVKTKLEFYEKTHEIPKHLTEDCYTTTTFDFWNFFKNENINESSTTHTYHFKNDQNYHEDTRSEEEMINDLGILYAILGSTYQTVLNYHVFKIRFKKQAPKDGAFYRVYSDVYEDNIKICENIIIAFWPLHFGDDRCNDIHFTSMSSDLIKKYNNGCSHLYIKLFSELINLWNFYFDNQTSVPMISRTIVSCIESDYQNSTIIQVQLNKEQRNNIIEHIENTIDSGKMKYLESAASKIFIGAYEPYHILSEFLEESGVVYKVETSGVYIWDYFKKTFKKLVGYEYSNSKCSYCLYLL